MPRLTTSRGDIAGVVFAAALFAVLVMVPQEIAVAPPAPPVIDLVMASRDTVFTSQSSEVFCVAHQDDSNALTYIWSSPNGVLFPSTDSAVWVAPEESGSYAIVVQVQDEAGGFATDAVTITVEQNEPPTVLSVSATPADLLPGQSATLFCKAVDQEGQNIAYDWIAPQGVTDANGPTATWTAPAQPGTHYVAVRVTDEMGAGRTRNVAIDVTCPDPPAIEELLVWPALPDYTKTDIRGGYRLLRGSLTECQIECVAIAPYGDLSYEWSSTEGTIAGKGPIVLFTPPNATAEVYVTVKVGDVCGQSVQDELRFLVFQREDYSTEIVTNEVGCLRCMYGY